MDIDAFILIGGRSSRLGRAKAFVEVDRETLAVRAARVIKEALAPKHITFVTSSDDQFDPNLLFGLGQPIVSDLKPGFGAWSGLHAALAYARSEWTLVLACDLPFVTAEFVRTLAECMGEEFDAVIPRQTDGRIQPLCAYYRVGTTRQAVDQLLTVPRRVPAVATVTELVRGRIVEPNQFAALDGSEKFFHNVNTEDDVPMTT